MIFFVANDGTVIKTVPSPVYQGGAGTNNVYLVAPFATNMSVTVAFKLPNGVWTPVDLMQNGLTKDGNMALNGNTPLEGAGNAIIDRKTGATYAVWSYTLPNEITRYYGTVTAQFFFHGEDGIVTPTNAANFTVGRGVPVQLPEGNESGDILDKIYAAIKDIRSSLDGGEYTAQSIYPWCQDKAYGANEIVWYPFRGEHGVFLKSKVNDNANAPYVADKELNAAYWEEIVDFDVLNILYALKQDMLDAVAKSESDAAAAELSAENAELSAEIAAQSSAAAAESEKVAKQSEENIVAFQDKVDGILNGTDAVPKATADATGKDIAEQFSVVHSDIEGLRKDFSDESHFRGMFETLAALQAAYPTATPNDFAWIVDGNIWIYTADAWTDSGQTTPANAAPLSDSVPLMDGVAGAGTSKEGARADHRHPSDQNKLNKSGDTMTGNLSFGTAGYIGQYDNSIVINASATKKVNIALGKNNFVSLDVSDLWESHNRTYKFPTNSGTLALEGGPSGPATNTKLGTVYGVTDNYAGAFLGYNVTGSGGSVAIGINAIGHCSSTVVGDNAYAGHNGVALGCGSNGIGATALGWGSVAIGYVSSANGQNSIAIGRSAHASHVDTIAIGNSASITSNASNAISIGSNAKLIGSRSIAIGCGSRIERDDSIAIGHNSAVGVGNGATVLGSGARSMGMASVSIGIGTIAYGDYSVVVGADSRCEPGELYMTALGFRTRVEAGYSTAIGFNAVANTANTIVLGDRGISYLKCSRTAITALSDKRLKLEKDKVNTALCLNNIEQIPVHRYHFVNGVRTGDVDFTKLGFFAQEVEKIYPKDILTMKDESEYNAEKLTEEERRYLLSQGAKFYEKEVEIEDAEPEFEEVEKTDENGETYTERIKKPKPTEIKEFFSIMEQKELGFEQAIPTMWAAIKELSAQVKELQIKVEKLEKEQAAK